MQHLLLMVYEYWRRVYRPRGSHSCGGHKDCKWLQKSGIFFLKMLKKIFHLVTQIIYVQPINQSQKLVLVGWVAGLTMGHKKDL